MLFVVCRSLFVCDVLLLVCLFGLLGLLCVIACLVFGGGCVSVVVCRLLLVVLCALFVVCSLLCVVRRL